MNRLIRFVLTAALFAIPLMGTALAQQAKPIAPSQEAIELRAQLTTIRDYQDRFIEIVQWSLSTVVTVTIGLLAFGWYTNKTTYERDRDALRQERDTMRHELRAHLSDEMRLALQELRSTISESEKPLQERLEKVIETKLKSMSSRVNDLKDSVLELSHENLERDAKDAMRDKKYNWAVYKYCAMLDSSVKRQTDYYEVPDILDSMKKALEMPGVKMYADDVTTTVDALKRLPAKYQVAAEKLIDLVRGLQ